MRASELTTPPVTTETGPLDTLEGWAAADSAVAAIVPKYLFWLGASANQFMDRATLDKNIALLATLPAQPAASAVVLDGAGVVVQSVANVGVAGSPGIARVAAGALTKVNLTV
jgi:hypothetical protein